MSLTTLILQIVLTIPLTILLSLFTKKENRALNYILIPTLYIVLLSALLPSIKTNIFLIVIFEIFIRNFYVTNIVNREEKISTKSFLIESLLSIALSLFAYNYFISKVDTVIPDPEDIKPFIWFLLILYTAYLYKISTKNKIKIKETKIKGRKKEQTIIQYAKLKNTYSNFVKTNIDTVKYVTYAIMIFNDNQTPKLYRGIKEYIGLVTKKETKYSIMQIPSFTKIKDEDGIKQTIKEMESKLKNTALKEREQLDKLLSTYTLDEKEEIMSIYKEIVEFEKK